MIRYKLSDDPTDALRMAWAAHLGYCADEDQVYGWPDDLDQFAAGWYARDSEVDRLRAIEEMALAQSDDVQTNWLSPIEAAGLRAENDRLREENERMTTALIDIADGGEFVPLSDIGRRMDIDTAKRALGTT